MIRGLYSSAAGMIVNQKQSETIGENMDNMRNPGYREEQRKVEAFPQLFIERVSKGEQSPEAAPVGVIGTGVNADQITMKTVPGLIQQTDQNTDIALVSKGFFVVQTLAGERYTRNGHFRTDPDGMLRTTSGNIVLGEKGPIGPLTPQFEVNLDGSIRDQGQLIDRLRIVDISGEALKREGKTTLYSTNETPTAVDINEIRIRQGALEESNVDVNTQLVKMVTVTRAYEANQRVIQTQDATLEKAVNEIGKV